MPALRLPLLLLIACSGLSAAPKNEVPAKYHTPYDLYLSPQEAYALKLAHGDGLLFIDVRTRAEFKYIGIADPVDANIPVRLLRDDYAWSDRAGTFRTRENPDFVVAVERLLERRGLDRSAPVIVMCQAGSRAPIAARLMHAAGFKTVYTQYQGFEGFKAKAGPRRGQRVVNGWKNAGLPWRYALDRQKMYFNFAP